VQLKQVVAQQVLEAFELMIAGGSGSSVSLPMRAVLMPCILTLMDKGGTLLDLQRFMQDGRNSDLVTFGKSRVHYPQAASFFQHEFHDRRFAITKGSISTKLQELFNSGFFADLTCGPSTVKLHEAIRQKKIIVFNLAKSDIGVSESQSFGRLLVSLILGIALRRTDRTPIHLLIDECHNLITPSIRTILLEARKFNLHLFLAQQILGEGMTPAMADVITGSCNVRITAYQHRLHQQAAARLLGADPEQVASLKEGMFLMSVGRHQPICFRGRTDLLGYGHSMTKPSWNRLKARQLRTYYRAKGEQGRDMPKDPPAGDGYEIRPQRW
jgi:hypothetical protein